jgi:hypothetical protein
MEKPKLPRMPRLQDYPDNPIKGKNYLGEPVELPNEDYVKDYHKYQKAMDSHKADMELFEQTRLIEDIKRSSLVLCLKKYKITKKK